jgi:hypothetical protein
MRDPMTGLARDRRHPRCPGATAVMIRLLIMAALMCCAATMVAGPDDPYRGQTVVTGQGEANRFIGFAFCLEDVLIKVSGVQKLAGDPRLTAYKSRAGDFVRAHRDHDQMSGTPTRDEQGTRDRPYDLIVDFDKEKIDGLLKALGLKPWLSHRPVLAVFVEMEQGPREYIVTADAAQSMGPRESPLAAAAKRGMTIVLPAVAALANSGIGDAELAKVPSSTLAPRAAEEGGEVTLVGRLVWNDRELGWATGWQMEWQGRPHRWQFRCVTFDKAFRRAIGGAAQIPSDNGDPA